MALFQPTNLIPSTFVGISEGTTVDVNSQLAIGWQINGDSQLQKFQIDFFDNTAYSNNISTTGILSNNCPANGLDAKGNPVFFNYTSEQNWSNYNLTNGNSYKYQITQFFSNLTMQTTSYELEYDLVAGTNYCLSYNNQYFSLTPPTDLVSGSIIYYDVNSGKGWVLNNNIFSTIELIAIASSSGYIYLGALTLINNNDSFFELDFVKQYSDAVFLTRTNPVLTINIANLNNNTLNSIILNATATYSQAQGDTLNWVQWKLTGTDDEGTISVVEETPLIYTNVLSYNYDGLLSGYTYELTCTIETVNGIQASIAQTIIVEYENNTETTSLIISCAEKDGSILITWQEPEEDSNIIATSIYRQNDFDNHLELMYNLPANITQIKDFGIKSGEDYTYTLFFIDNNNTYSKAISSDSLCKQYKYYFLIEATQDPNFANTYHVLQIFKFGNNINYGSISNNNTPSWLNNFTPYRFKQNSCINGKSGTLQALLGNYNAQENIYNDTPRMMDQLFNISLSKNTFFLKDPKGNLYMVGISNPITQTINTKSQLQETTVKISWEEIGTTEGISLIQTPLDEGWSLGENNRVFETQFNIDISTGNLSVTYPSNYIGTRFSLQNNQLFATTPNDIIQVIFTLENGIVSVSPKSNS